MGRLRRFEDHRFLGTRDDMRVYDCDDESQFAIVSARADAEDLLGANLISTVAPDTLEEARNRGFRPVSGAAGDGEAS